MIYFRHAHGTATQVDIPDSVTEIGSWTCHNNLLLQVVIPDSVVTIGERAFSLNPLTHVSVPARVSTTDSFSRKFSNFLEMLP